MDLRWHLLDELVTRFGASELPAPFFDELAVRVHEAVAAKDPGECEAMATQLAEILEQACVDAPRAVAEAAYGMKGADSAASKSFVLGKLAFSQSILAEVAARRAAGGFEGALLSQTLSPYVEALAARDMSGVELARHLDRRPETVSRALKELREMGAVDFRREGTTAINSLTPAARHLFETSRPLRPTRTELPPEIRALVNRMRDDEAPIMRVTPSFARELEGSDD